MNLSGIIVITSPARLPEVCQSLREIDGIEVFHADTDQGRIVIVQEADSVNEEIAGLKRIKALPHIVMAEMVHHYIGDSDDISPLKDIPTDLDDLTGLSSAVPAWLNH